MVKGNVFEDAKFSSTAQRQFNYVQESMKHPAKMSPELARELILAYSKKGDTILDPMAGIGTTIIESILLGRNAIGIEYEQKFKEIIDKNIQLTAKNNEKSPIKRKLGKAIILKGDARNLNNLLDQKIDSGIFSPPYSETLDPRKKSSTGPGATSLPGATKKGTEKSTCEAFYSKDPQNIGNKDNQTYLSEMKKVYAECYKTLRPGGFMVLVTKNFRRGGKEVNLLSDTIKLCEIVGFELYQIAYHKLQGASFWQVNAAIKANQKGEPLLLPLIEHVIVLKKPKRQTK